jgi:hypothetical protein
MRQCTRCNLYFPLDKMRERATKPYPLHCKPCARELDRERLLKINGPLDALGQTVLIKPWGGFFVVLGYKKPQAVFVRLNDAIHYACKTWCNFMLKTIDMESVVAWEDHTLHAEQPRPSPMEILKDTWRPPKLIDMQEVNTPVWLPQGKL